MKTWKKLFVIAGLIVAFIGGLILGSSQPSDKGYHSPDEIYPQGEGSGLNADLLDGYNSSDFLGGGGFQNPATENLDMNNYNITNVAYLNEKNASRFAEKAAFKLYGIDCDPESPEYPGATYTCINECKSRNKICAFTMKKGYLIFKCSATCDDIGAYAAKCVCWP